MTRSEAAQICQSIKFILENSDYTEAVEEALNMAIEALEPCEDKRTDKRTRANCISRQAAIDAFDGVKVDEQTEYDIGYNDGIDFAVSKLSVLPTAQPERPKGKWIATEYDTIKCGECGIVYSSALYPRKYCPNCGADMREANKK